MRTVKIRRRKSPEQLRFEEFHRDNPHIYRGLVRGAREWKAAGHGKCSIWFLINALRWDSRTSTTRKPGDYKISNGHAAYYSRLIMSREPDLDGFFDTRPMQNDPNY